MKRRNFLSGLMAAPVALKARFLALFQKRPVELCGAPILEWSTARPQSWRGIPLSGLKPSESLPSEYPATPTAAIRKQPKSLTARQQEIVQMLIAGSSALFYCSLPRGHKGPHALLNPR